LLLSYNGVKDVLSNKEWGLIYSVEGVFNLMNKEIKIFGTTLKPRNIIVLLFLIVSFLTIVSLLVLKENNYKENKKKLYIDSAVSLANDIRDSLINAETVGVDIGDYWYDYIYNDKYDSIDNAVATAQSDNIILIELLKLEKNKIDTNYKSLLENYDEELKLASLSDSLEELYDSYYRLYNIVINPSGNYMSFVSNYKEADNGAAEDYNKVKLLLE